MLLTLSLSSEIENRAPLGSGSGRPLTLTDWVDVYVPPSPSRQAPRTSARPTRTTCSQARTVNVRVAGVGSGLPAASMARTWKLCSPPLSGVIGPHGAQATSSTPFLVTGSTRHSNVAPGSDA